MTTPNSASDAHRRFPRALVPLVLVSMVAGFTAVCWFVRGLDGKDYLELSLLTRYALTQGMPYHAAATGIAYADAGFPPTGESMPGFIYPPALFPVVAPFAALPYPVGVRLWFLALTGAGVATVLVVGRFAGAGRPTLLLATGVLLASSITQSAFSVGQGAILIALGVAVGTAALRNGRWWLAAVGWSVIAMKPQIGLPFLLVALACRGWRGGGLAVAAAGATTLAGAALTGAPVETLRSYLPHASQTVFLIGYNTVENDQIVGWNRALFVSTGVGINLSATGMLVGFAGFAAVAALRERLGGHSRSLPYWLAVASVIGPVFGQAKGYDLVVLALWLPYLLETVRSGRRRELVVFLLFVLVVSLPRGLVLVFAQRTPIPETLLSYRCFALLALAAGLLFRGPISSPPARRGDQPNPSPPTEAV